ncbi:F-box-like domain protein, putative, partial [Rhizoctonia solani AG-3 Rhs1AP]
MTPDVVPISRLPTDILDCIFQQLVAMEYSTSSSSLTGQNKPKYPISLTHVCRTWRQIIYQSPSLWSRIRLTPDIQTNEQLISCLNFYAIRVEQAPTDVYVTDLSLIQAFETPTVAALDPFLAHIRSLEFQLNITDASVVETSKDKICYLISKFLREKKTPLKRFVFNMVTFPKQELSFMESASKRTSYNNPTIDLPYELLENALYSITDLWLGGLYFNWQSRAYHGLTKLRLDICQPSSSTIPESQFINILASSPRLQYLNIDLDIIQKTPSPPITHLPDLEVMVGDVSLPKLIWPGTRDLSISIIGQPNRDSGALYDPRIQDFFSRANITAFLGDVFLHDVTELSQLLSITANIRILALTEIMLSGALPEIVRPSLDVVYLLGECEIEWSLLQQMVEMWGIKKLVFWRKNYIIRDSSQLIDSKQALEEVLPDLNILLEFARISPMDMFIGPNFH